MQSKVWHKPLHKRKIWRQTSICAKIIYYLEPFVGHLIDTWLQPLPFPTILKILYSCVILMFILLPIIIHASVLLFSYAILQFIVEQHVGIIYPTSLDLLNYCQRVYYYKVTNPTYVLFSAMYFERWRLLGIGIASSIDYIRLALCLIFEMIED